MTLRRAYELGMVLATTVGMLAVLLGGELPVVAWLSLGVPVVSLALSSRGRSLPAQLGTAFGAVGVLALGYSLVVVGLEGLVVGGALFLLAVLVGRLLTRETLAHDLQALLMAVLLVFAGSVLHTQITYGLVFVVFSISMVWALVARQLVVGAEREAARPGGADLSVTLGRTDVVTPTFLGVTAGLAVVLLLVTGALFLLFPRVGMGSLGFLNRGRGILPDDVSLTADPRAGAGGGTVVARVSGLSELSFDRGLYLRGPVFDELRLGGFGRSPANEGRWQAPAARMAPVEEVQGYEVFMQPVAGRTLFTLGPVERAGILAGGATNPSVRRRIMPVGFHPELRTFRPMSGPTRLAVFGGISHGLPPPRAELPDDADLSEYLEFPDELDPRVAALAQSVAGDGEIFRRVGRLRSFLRDGFAYSLDQDNGGKRDPLVGFLFEDRRGHCEYFATAFAVMLRAVGVPSRVVGGFQGGLWDETAEVAVFTSANAHAWVEWYVPGHGWVTDDATPAALEGGSRLAGLAVLWERMARAWDEYVVEYSLLTQWQLFTGTARNLFGGSGSGWRSIHWRRGAIRVLVIFAALVGFLAGWILVRRILRSRRRREGLLLRALREALERTRGEPLPREMTLREAVRAAAQHREVFDPALEAYEQHRFGGRAIPASRERRLARALDKVRG